MKVDVSEIIGNSGASMAIAMEEEPVVKQPVDGYFLDGMLLFKGTVTNRNEILLLDGSLKTTYRSECYRCLAPVGGTLDIVIKENFINSDDAEQNDMYYFNGKILDISKALIDNIILNLPMKQLCSNNCKGLCSICGGNLNNEECDCESKEVDPRMEGLKNFFDN